MMKLYQTEKLDIKMKIVSPHKMYHHIKSHAMNLNHSGFRHQHDIQ